MKMNDKETVPTLFWKNNRLDLLDQRLLPQTIRYRTCRSCDEVVESISSMCVRGAPAIGVSAAFGMVLAAIEALDRGYNSAQTRSHIDEAAAKLRSSRPTAVNLAWALERINKWLRTNQDASPEQIVKGLEQEAMLIFEEDVENNRRLGSNGAELVPQKASILTHCNAGALATGGFGTALGVIRAAVMQGKAVHVFVDETRPLLQGSRLTAFELHQDGIPATLITDNCAGSLMAGGKIDLVIVGADRIAANGDAANKIGTYSLAVLAKYHQVPFYVAAPLSTIDFSIASGSEIVIEERCRSEITHIDNRLIAPEDVAAFNPAFDVTPAGLIDAIITEKGIVFNPNRLRLAKLMQKQ